MDENKLTDQNPVLPAKLLTNLDQFMAKIQHSIKVKEGRIKVAKAGLLFIS